VNCPGPGNMLTGELITITVRFSGARARRRLHCLVFRSRIDVAEHFSGSNTKLQGACYDISVGNLYGSIPVLE